MNNDKMMCPRCGTEMKINSRYCMKCGYLNYNHPENVALKPYMGKLQETTNFVNGNVQMKQFFGARKAHEIRFGSKTGNKKICYFLNVLLYIICMVLAFLAVYRNYEFLIDLLYSSLPFWFLGITVIFIYLYAIELIFMKMNEKWWNAFIPIYNVFVLSYRGLGSYWYGLIGLLPLFSVGSAYVLTTNGVEGYLNLIPLVLSIISAIYYLVLAYNIGKKFNFNGFIFMLFWPIFIPLCGFGASAFDGVTYVNGLDNISIEKEYKLTNSFVIVTSLVLVSCLGLIGYLNRTVFLDPMKSLEKYYYVYASRAIVNKVKTDIKIRTINCDEGLYLLYEDGDYYFYYGSASSKADLLFKNSRDEIESYVKVVTSGGKSEYYISLTDGKYGIEEKEVSKIGIKDVKKMETLSQIYTSGNNCKVKNQ